MRNKRLMQLFYQLLQRQYEVTIESQSPTWIRNLRRNSQYVTRSIGKYNTGPADTCLIFAPGASITQYEEDLIQLRRSNYYVVATPTVVPWMKQHGLTPDLVIAVDSHETQAENLRAAPYHGHVFMPTYGCHELAKGWECWYFNISVSKAGYTPFMDMVIQTQYPELPTLPSMGHATGAALQIMMTMTSANLTSFKRYVLVGADYSYYRGMPRVPLPGDDPRNQVTGPVLDHDGIKTDHRMPFYKERLQAFLQGNPDAAVYLCAQGILNDTLPEVSWEDLLAERFPPPATAEEIAEAHRKYLLEDMPRLIVPELLDTTDSGWKRFARYISGGKWYARGDAHNSRAAD